MKKVIIVLVIMAFTGTWMIFHYRSSAFVKEWSIRLLGDKALENYQHQTKTAVIPAKLLSFGHTAQNDSGISVTWAYRVSHISPTYPVPLVADVDHDGMPEIYIGSYSKEVSVLEGATGHLLWSWSLPFGLVGGRVMFLQDIDNDNKPELIFGSANTLPIRVYAIATGAAKGNRLIWKTNVTGDFLEGGLNVYKDTLTHRTYILAATRDAPYSRGSINMIGNDGKLIYEPIEGVDNCISRPAIGILPYDRKASFIHGSHSFYNAKYANHILARDVESGKILWTSAKLGDGGMNNHQIVDVDFDGKNEVLAFAFDSKQKKTRKFLLNGNNGATIKEVPWEVQGVLRESKHLLVQEGDTTRCIDAAGKLLYSIPAISFGTPSGKTLLLYSCSYANDELKITTYNASNGKQVRDYRCAFKLPPYEHPEAYGIFGEPSATLSFLTLADTDNNGKWDLLFQFRDYVVNVTLPVKILPGIDPFAPIPFRNIDNNGVIYR